MLLLYKSVIDIFQLTKFKLNNPNYSRINFHLGKGK